MDRYGAVRLDVTDAQSGLLRAAGARRFAFNSAVAKIKANADHARLRTGWGHRRGAVDHRHRPRPWESDVTAG
jgi:hypothetical protein